MVDTIPSYEGMMPVVLKVLADGQSKPLKQVYDDVTALYAVKAIDSDYFLEE